MFQGLSRKNKTPEITIPDASPKIDKWYRMQFITWSVKKFKSFAWLEKELQTRKNNMFWIQSIIRNKEIGEECLGEFIQDQKKYCLWRHFFDWYNEKLSDEIVDYECVNFKYSRTYKKMHENGVWNSKEILEKYLNAASKIEIVPGVELSYTIDSLHQEISVIEIKRGETEFNVFSENDGMLIDTWYGPKIKNWVSNVYYQNIAFEKMEKVKEFEIGDKDKLRSIMSEFTQNIINDNSEKYDS